MLLVSLSACAAWLVACPSVTEGADAGTDAGPTIDGGADAGGGGGDAGNSDAGPHVPGSCTPNPNVPARALLVTSNTLTLDGVAVYRLTSSGRIEDTGAYFGGFDNPRAVAVRGDGREAVVAYGQLDGPCGLVVIAMEPDGSGARVVQRVALENLDVPWSLEYTAADHLVMATEGAPTGHQLLAIDRQPDGGVDVTTRTPIPGDWPIQVVARPGHDEAVLLRANLLDEHFSELIPLQRIDGGWVPSGASARIVPATIALAAHPSGERIYSPSYDAGMGGPGIPEGVLFISHFDGGSLVPDMSLRSPLPSSPLAVTPDGNTLVLTAPILGVDSQGRPATRRYKLQTVPLDATGSPTGPAQVAPDSDSFPGLLFHGFVIGQGNYLVIAHELYPDQVENDGGTQYRLQAWEQVSAAGWKPVCEPQWLTGQPRVGLAP